MYYKKWKEKICVSFNPLHFTLVQLFFCSFFRVGLELRRLDASNNSRLSTRRTIKTQILNFHFFSFSFNSFFENPWQAAYFKNQTQSEMISYCKNYIIGVGIFRNETLQKVLIASKTKSDNNNGTQNL